MKLSTHVLEMYLSDDCARNKLRARQEKLIMLLDLSKVNLIGVLIMTRIKNVLNRAVQNRNDSTNFNDHLANKTGF